MKKIYRVNWRPLNFVVTSYVIAESEEEAKKLAEQGKDFGFDEDVDYTSHEYNYEPFSAKEIGKDELKIIEETFPDELEELNLTD